MAILRPESKRYPQQQASLIFVIIVLGYNCYIVRYFNLDCLLYFSFIWGEKIGCLLYARTLDGQETFVNHKKKRLKFS